MFSIQPDVLMLVALNLLAALSGAVTIALIYLWYRLWRQERLNRRVLNRSTSRQMSRSSSTSSIISLYENTTTPPTTYRHILTTFARYHLKLNWTSVYLFWPHSFPEILSFLAPHRNLIIALTLKDFPVCTIPYIANYFTILTSLKLKSDSVIDLTSEVTEPLQRLTRLSSVSLLNYNLLPSESISNPLRCVIKLTLSNTGLLFGHFYTEDEATIHDNAGIASTRRRRLNVPAFTTALFTQFPALRELNIFGAVHGADVVRKQLAEAFAGRLKAPCNMLFVEAAQLRAGLVDHLVVNIV